MHISLDQVLQTHPLTVPPHTPLQDAIAAMSQHRTSCVLVAEDNRLSSLFTERHLVQLIATNCYIPDAAISTAATSKVITLAQSDFQNPFTALQLMQQRRIRHLPVVDECQQLQGLLTYQSIRDALKPEHLLRFRKVSEVMSAGTICAYPSAALQDIVQLMAIYQVSCVVIVEPPQPTTSEREPAIESADPDPNSCQLAPRRPIGIITERDILQFQALDLDFQHQPAGDTMSAPLFFTHAGDTLWDVHQQFKQRHVRRLVVVDEANCLQGIITQTDVLGTLDPVEMFNLLETLQRRLTDCSDGFVREVQQHRQTEEKFIKLFSLSPDPIAITTLADGRFLEVSDSFSRCTGYSRDELIGQTVSRLGIWTGTETSERKSLTQQLLTDRSLRDVEVTYRTKAGEIRYALLSADLIEMDGEQCILGISKDITERKKSVSALIESEERFREIASTIKQFFFLRSASSGQFLYISPAYEGIWGRSREILYRDPDDWLAAIHPDDRPLVDESLQQQFQGNSLRREYRIVKPGGAIHWIACDISVVRDEAGQAVRYVGLAEDITERKIAEENLQRYKRIVSATSDGISLVDRNYVYQIVNQTYVARSQKPFEALVGHPVSNFLGSEIFETVIKPQLDRCLAGETTRYQHWFDYPALGRQFVDVTYTPYREADGSVSGAIVTTRDLTAFKQIEDALRESQTRLQRSLQASQTACWEYILETGELIGVGELSAEGWSPTTWHFPIKEAINYIHPDDRGEVLQVFQQAMESGTRDYQVEHRVRLPSGDSRWILIRGRVLTDDRGAPQSIVGVSMDISDRKRAELTQQQLQQRGNLIWLLTQRIHQSVDLKEIFQVTVDEVRKFLQVDRVLVYQFEPNYSGTVTFESVGEGWQSVLGRHILDVCLAVEDCIHPYAQGKIQATEDILTAGFADCYAELLTSLQVRANLVVPIAKDGQLWGLLVAQHCAEPRAWQATEIDLLQQLAMQVAIAVQRTDFYQQLQAELAERQRAELALRDSEQLYRTMARYFPGAIFLFDRDLRYRVADGQDLMIRSRESLEGQTIWDALPADTVTTIEPLYRSALAGEEHALEREENGRFHLVRSLPVRDETGEVSLGMVVVDDITEQRQAALALHQRVEQEQSLNRVVQAIRHSLDLETIFAVTTQEVADLLIVQQVTIVQYLPKESVWRPVAHYTAANSEVPSVLDLEIADADNPYADCLKQLNVVQVEDTATIEDPTNQAIAEQFPGSWLLVPLAIQGQIWGSLTCRTAGAYCWEVKEIELVQRVADQLAIAIQQAELYKQVQRELTERQRAEAALRRSESLLKEIEQLSNLGGWDCDFRTGESTWTEETYHIHDLPAEADLQFHPHDPEPYFNRFYGDPTTIHQAFITARDRGEAYDLELPFITATGKQCWVRTTANPVEEDGTVVRLVGYMRDITERKWAEIALQRSEEQLRTLVRDIDCGIIVESPQGKTIASNEKAQDLLGLTKEQLQGQAKYDPRWRAICEDGLPFTQAVHPGARAIATRQPVRDVVMGVQRPDRDRTIWLLISAAPQIDDQGNLDRVILSFMDITDRKYAELKLRQSRDLREVVFNSSADALFLVNPRTHLIVDCNDRAVQIFQANERNDLLNIRDTEFHRYPCSQEEVDEMTTALQQQGMWQSEIEYLTLKGQPFWGAIAAKAIDVADERLNLVRISDTTERKRTQMALQESEERFRQLAETIDEAFYIADGRLHDILYVSPAYEMIWGRSCQSVYEMPNSFLQAIHPADRDRFVQSIKRQQQGEDVSEEYRIIRPDGSQRWIWDRSFPLRDETGTVYRICGVAQDISDRKSAESALRRYKRIVSATTDGIVLVDRQYRYRLANQAYLNLHQKQRDDIIGHPVAHILGQETFEQELKGFMDRCLAGETVRYERWSEQGDLGRQFLSVTYSPYFEEDENIASGIVASIRNITDLVRAEVALKESEERFRSIFEQVTVAIAQSDFSSHILLANPAFCQLVEYSQDELLQMTFEEITHPEDLAESQEQRWQLEQGEILYYSAERRYLCKSGQVKWVHLTATPVYDSDGNRRFIAKILQDISDRKQIEAEVIQAKNAAEAANRAKSEFLASVSHELRTPLNGVLGYAQILQRDKTITEEQQGRIKIIYQCGDHLLNLINDILDLSKIEAGKLELYPDDLKLLPFLQDIADICRIRAAQKGIEFSYQTLNRLPPLVRTDGKRLRQVLLNLLGNAIKFTDDGTVSFKVEAVNDSAVDDAEWFEAILSQGGTVSSLQLPATRDSGTCRIRFQVEDTGAGISAEDLRQIFLPFEQTGDGPRRAEGTGLGLAISQHILHMMGSRIEVDSTPGAGSCFWFEVEFPASKDGRSRSQAAAQLAGNLNNIVGYEGEQRTILLVDDNRENRSFLTDFLQPLGFNVLEAPDGQAGLDTAIATQPDAIFIDLVMPTMDGFELTHWLRRTPELEGTVLIATSANLLGSEQQRSLEAGCDAFLPKPIESEKLLEILQQLLDLTWQFVPTHSAVVEETASTPIELPPDSELLSVRAAVAIGDFDRVEAEARRIQTLHPRYLPFATRLLQLTQEYEQTAIENLLRSRHPSSE